MNNLTSKEVNFNGDVLMAAQEKDTEKVYVAVRWVCEGIGWSSEQIQYQINRMKKDVVLSQGTVSLPFNSNTNSQETLCIELDYLPLWIARTPITPAMKESEPVLTEQLINYQLNAKKVLEDAFIQKEEKEKVSDLTYLQGLLDKMKQDELQNK